MYLHIMIIRILLYYSISVISVISMFSIISIISIVRAVMDEAPAAARGHDQILALV